MADSTADISKLKVVELKKELKARGLPSSGDKSELVARLQAALSQEHVDGDINLDSDEIDSDGVLEDEDDKSQADLLDDSAGDALSEELALAEPRPAPASQPHRTLKRKLTATADTKPTDKEATAKKIVLNRSASITTPVVSNEEKSEPKPAAEPKIEKVKITAVVDTKERLEQRAKRFGLGAPSSDNEKKQARLKRFGLESTITAPSGGGGSAIIGASKELTDNLEKLKKRAERFGQSVSKVMLEIEKKEKLEKRKAKFNTA